MSWYDAEVAKKVHEQLNCTGLTENAIIPKEKENYRPRSLVDQTLEYIDPTPNIFTLFMQFNEKFFWNVLLPVQVKWSPRMTSCAGICSFHPRSRECIISLSTPLLKLRPRKDLIETLLHEMIHAYLFLTNNNRDRDGHGPVFQSHMKRINQQAGTNITIYHTFHEEVRLYQQHWWRCNGPCQKRSPYFGMVRRAMNRAPGPNDLWWAEHQVTCGGQFTKVKEPEKPAPKPSKRKSTGNKSVITKPANNTSIFDWAKKNGGNKKVSPAPSTKPASTSSNKKSNSIPVNALTDLTKLDNSPNNSLLGRPTSTPSKTGNPHFSYSGTLGGSGAGRSNLLDKYFNNTTVTTAKSLRKEKSLPKTTQNKTNNLPSTSRNSNINSYLENSKSTIPASTSALSTTAIRVNCPNCNKSVEEAKINEHLDVCLLDNSNEPEMILSKKRKSNSVDTQPNKIAKSTSDDDAINCPLCNKKVMPIEFNDHLEKCLKYDFKDEGDKRDKKDKNNYEDHDDNDVIELNDSGSSSVNLHDSPNVCLICDKPLQPNETLNMHLETCVASVFNDSADDDFESKTVETKEPEVLDEYPCPVCMELVHHSLMNEHLDSCIDK